MIDGRYPTILLFGAPGAGKGTQGTILGTIPGFYHLSCGDVFRSLNIRSPDGREIYEYSSRGELVPDEVTVRIWKKALHGQIAVSRYNPPDELLFLDGIPRNVKQAEIISDTIDVLHVIHLICSDLDQMVDRMKRRAIRENRVDDANEEVIRRRFSVYDQETNPVIEFYSKSIITRIDALQSPAQVLHDVLKCVIPVQRAYLSTLPSSPYRQQLAGPG